MNVTHEQDYQHVRSQFLWKPKRIKAGRKRGCSWKIAILFYGDPLHSFRVLSRSLP